MTSTNLLAALAVLRSFIGRGQLQTLRAACHGEEGPYFRDLLHTYGARVATMPKTYEQDGLGQQAIAHLHYFTAGCDWYVTERDTDPAQHQAFGLANLGYGGELGYLSLPELLAAGAELDLHFTPRPLAQCGQEGRAA